MARYYLRDLSAPELACLQNLLFNLYMMTLNRFGPIGDLTMEQMDLIATQLNNSFNNPQNPPGMTPRLQDFINSNLNFFVEGIRIEMRNILFNNLKPAKNISLKQQIEVHYGIVITKVLANLNNRERPIQPRL